MTEASIPRPRTEQGPLRCPYCHGDVDPAAPGWVACRACLARHHDDCFGGACSACGALLEPADRPAPARRAGRGGTITVGGAVRAGLAAYGRPGALSLVLQGAFASLLGRILFPLQPFFSAGLWTMALAQQRGQPVRGSALWTGGAHRFLALVATGLVLGVASLLALLAFVVPGVWLAAHLCYVYPLMTEGRLSAREAIRESAARAGRSGLGAHMGLAMLALLASLIGLVPFGFLLEGLLTPGLYGAFAWAYLRTGGEGEKDDVEAG